MYAIVEIAGQQFKVLTADDDGNGLFFTARQGLELQDQALGQVGRTHADRFQVLQPAQATTQARQDVITGVFVGVFG